MAPRRTAHVAATMEIEQDRIGKNQPGGSQPFSAHIAIDLFDLHSARLSKAEKFGLSEEPTRATDHGCAVVHRPMLDNGPNHGHGEASTEAWHFSVFCNWRHAIGRKQFLHEIL